MNEASFWSDRVRPGLIRQCKTLGLRHHFERTENAVASGTPDVDYCIAGVAGKIELKFAPRHPVREDTTVLGEGKGLRRSQIIYAARRGWCGGRVWLMIGTPAMTWLVDLRDLKAPDMADLSFASTARLNAISAWRSSQGITGTLPLALIDEALKDGQSAPRPVKP